MWWWLGPRRKRRQDSRLGRLWKQDMQLPISGEASLGRWRMSERTVEVVSKICGEAENSSWGASVAGKFKGSEAWGTVTQLWFEWSMEIMDGLLDHCKVAFCLLNWIFLEFWVCTGMLLGAGSTQETRGLAQRWGPLLRGYFNSAFQFLVAVGTRSQGNELRGNSWLVISSKAELAAWPTHVGARERKEPNWLHGLDPE